MLVSIGTALPDILTLCSPPCLPVAALSCPAIINLMLIASIPCRKSAASRTPAGRFMLANPPCGTLEPAKQTHVVSLPQGWANTVSHGHLPWPASAGMAQQTPTGQDSQSWKLAMLCLLPICFAGQILPWDTPAQPRLGTSPSSASTSLQIKLATDFLPLT